MATYAAAYTEALTDAFRSKVRTAMTQVSLDVVAELVTTPNHASRTTFATAYLRQSGLYLDGLAIAVALGDITATSPDTGLGSFYDRCSAIFDAFAGKP